MARGLAHRKLLSNSVFGDIARLSVQYLYIYTHTHMNAHRFTDHHPESSVLLDLLFHLYLCHVAVRRQRRGFKQRSRCRNHGRRHDGYDRPYHGCVVLSVSRTDSRRPVKHSRGSPPRAHQPLLPRYQTHLGPLPLPPRVPYSAYNTQSQSHGRSESCYRFAIRAAPTGKTLFVSGSPCPCRLTAIIVCNNRRFLFYVRCIFLHPVTIHAVFY